MSFWGRGSERRGGFETRPYLATQVPILFSAGEQAPCLFLHRLEAFGSELGPVGRASCPRLDGLEARPTVLRGLVGAR